MPKNDYRKTKRQVSFVVDVEVMEVLRAKAERHGKTMTGYLTGLILKDLDREPQPTTPVGPRPAVPRPVPDWNAILAGGLAESARLGEWLGSVRDVASQTDPIEEIA